MLEDAFVLCAGDTIEAVGRMRDLPALDGDVAEVDCRGLCAIPGLVDCHTHAAFGGDRVDEFSLRAGGASYEELHAAGGGILSTVRATRAAGEAGLRAAVERHRSLDAPRRARRRSRPSRATGSTARRSSRRSGRSARLAASRPGSAPTRCRPSSPTPTPTSTSRSPRCCRRRRGLAEAADVFLERGAFDVAQARRYLEACRDAGLALRLHGDQFTEFGAIPLAVELDARSVDHLEATGEDGIRTLAASDVVGVLLPASALFLDRPMPPARALVDAGAAVALATDFNPGSAFCESLPLVCSLAATQLQPVAGRGARRLHGQRRSRARTRRPDRPARARLPRRRHRCSTRPTGATSPTTSAADVVARVVVGGELR